MNSFPLINMRRLSNLGVFAFAVLLLGLSNRHLNAQVGGDNPTGVAGAFNGQITTGCSYDAYTGNAMRSVTDIAVAGAVGEYPLALVRTANSRRALTSNTANPFGTPGHWNHSYNWILEDSAKSGTQSFQPSSYTVEFPDGRVETFQSVNWDTGYYRVRANGGDQTTAAGIRERVLPMNPPNNMTVKLYLPDGGRVEFLATPKQSGSNWYYSYVAQAIYDPNNLATTLTHETSGLGRLVTVTDPTGLTGRYLQFTYRTVTGQTQLIDKVTEYVNGAARRSVQYNYTSINPSNQLPYLALSSVSYFSQWTANYTYCVPNTTPNTGVPLLYTCDDPMYSGPMHKIGYIYSTAPNGDGSSPANGQIKSENHYNGTVGPAVSTLAVTDTNIRLETRGDGKMRTLTYGGGFLTSWNDFLSHGASQTYDDKRYINSVTDRNYHTTNYTLDPITGNVTQVLFPAIATPSPAPRGTLNYSYGSATCADSNNRDGNNPYYVCTATDEAGHVTQFWRDANKRVTRIDYPDTGYETFGYDAAQFYQLSTHRMTTGGTETFAYDTWHRRQSYSDPYHNSGNPSIQYSYDALDRVNGVTDALSQNTSFNYNDRGQLTMTTLPPDGGTRHTITNAYNNTGNNAGDGTLISVTDQLGHVTSYTYDDYRRVRSVTIPRQTQQTNGISYTTNYYYDANGVGDDYTLTDSDVTWVILPSGKKTHIMYDDNRRKQSVTIGVGTTDQATTSYTYDNLGNLTVLKLPLQQLGKQWDGKSTVTDYDERNRPWRITDALNNARIINYDQFGRKNKITRPNNQVITYDAFDQMNRVTQSTATAAGTTKYTYYNGSGRLHTMQDPRLVANNSTDNYSYTYDLMGRKSSVTYPTDSNGSHSSEGLWYDAAGRLWLFTNRSNLTQTFTYDALNRMTGFSWSDRTTPSVTFGYDAASRLISITNTDMINISPIATVSRTYFDDNLLKSETEDLTALGGTSKTITYNYDPDGNRSTLTYPGNSYSFTYGFNGRNQLASITNGSAPLVATYGYNLNGGMTSLFRDATGLLSTYNYDALDRIIHIGLPLNRSDTRTFDYDYDSVGNRKYMKREDNSGDVYGYDLNDQVNACWLDIMDPVNTDPGSPTIFYDGAGNLIGFSPYQWQQSYTTNNLNQYTQRYTIGQGTSRATPTPRPRGTPIPRPTPPGQQAAAYDNTGNISTSFDGATYAHDAQNRLTWDATPNYGTMLFEYDGLNRQVSRRIGTNGARTFSVWDGWDLIEEYQSGNNVTARYLYGPNGLVKNLNSGNLYYQDGSGSTSYVTDNTGQLLEFYLYDLQGTPTFYDANGNARYPNQTAIGVRHLFTGQQWYQELGLYDLRNRFYSPDIGRFLQPDPIGFNGDASNLYRYCGNNPTLYEDPLGLLYLYRPGQFAKGVGAFGLGTVSIVGGLATEEFIVGFGLWVSAYYEFKYGVNNIKASFSDDPADAAYQQQPSNLGGLAGAAAGGDAGQVLGETIEDVFGARAAKTLYERVTSGISVFQDGYDLGSLIGSSTILAHEGFSPNGFQSPGGQTGAYQDATGRWIVWATPIMPGDPVNGTAGIRDGSWGGFYTPFGSTTLSNPYGSWGPSFGRTIKGSIFGDGNFYSGLDPISAFPDIYDYNPIGAMEPGIGPGNCFVAGTPILMANGSEKPIDKVQVGEPVLAWNEETKTVFSTTVVRTLHHEETPQTLFDIELEDGRKLTVNNDHPMYVIEDGDFIFSDELATRYAKGKSVTFQTNNGQPVKVATFRMRRETCKTYNLYVQGQGKNGHTYYANGILVHNAAAGDRIK